MPNESERRRWNDKAWVAAWPRREALTTVVTPALLEVLKPKPGERILDIGSGGGGTTLAIARHVGAKGAVVGVDVSAGLNELAKERARLAKADNVSFHLADMQDGTVGDTTFDAATSQFGVMFFDEPVAAFKNIRRHMRKGARLVIATWQDSAHNPWHVGSALVKAGIAPRSPAPAPGKHAVGPFTMGDLVHNTTILEAAGFGDLRFTPHAMIVRASADAVVDESQFDFMGIAADRHDDARRVAMSHLQQFASTRPGLYRFPIAFLITEGINPG